MYGYNFDDMATINFLFRSTKETAPLTLRLLYRYDNKDHVIGTKTKYFLNRTDWKIFHSKSRDQNDRNLRSKISGNLLLLENHILYEFNKLSESKLVEVDKEWLDLQLHNYYEGPIEEKINTDLVFWIEEIIRTSNTRENSNGNLGLSKSRINSYHNLLKIITRFQEKKKFQIADVDIQFGKRFLDWMLNKQNYSESYARKKIDDLKTVCGEAEIFGVDTSKQLRKIKGGKPKNDSIIYLSPDELEKIENTTLISEALQNARKWLLLGCNIGQRGGDLLKLTKDNFINRNGLEVIELKQQKTGKQVTIPILEKTREIIKDGLPRPIAIQNFNNYIKDICEIAEIDEPIQGGKIVMVDNEGVEIEKGDKGKYIAKGVKRKISGTFPKHELVTSHVCRRSFASNLYGVLPTSLIMRITAHSTEKMLLNYIGKSSLDYAQQIADFYELQAQKEKKESKLEVIKNDKKKSNI